MMPRLASSLLYLIFLFAPIYSWALPSDRDQPIEIEADHAQLDDEQGITQYKGKAILTQGTLRIEGDIITFYYDDKKQLTKIVSQGKPATYKQIQKPGDPPIRAKALLMEYYARSQKIYLIRKAHVWQKDSEFRGERIEYDIAKNIVDVSGRLNKDKQPQKGERIHIVIQPPGQSKDSPATIIKPETITTPSASENSKSNKDSYPSAITTTNVNMRTGPGTQYEKIGTLYNGTNIVILTEQNDWVQVRGTVNQQTAIGWINRRYIRQK